MRFGHAVFLAAARLVGSRRGCASDGCCPSATRRDAGAAGCRSTISSLNAAWQPIGPNQVASIAYGNVTGRITAIAIDPADTSGNTVYLGTTGGGVWKSTNAAGPSASVTFTPLTDTLPVFSANAGTAAIPSLSIGAISVQSGVVLAGTGDPNDASDSFYGSGLLRSARWWPDVDADPEFTGWSGRQPLLQRARLCRICLEQYDGGHRGRCCFAGGGGRSWSMLRMRPTA